MTQPKAKPGTLLTRALFLALVGVLSGVVVNSLRPDGIPWVYAWSAHVEVRTLQAQMAIATVDEVAEATHTGSHIILDARSSDEFHRGAIPGAISLPFGNVEQAFPEVQLFLFEEQPIITYCSGPTCDEALLLGLFLRDQGYTNVAVYVAGFEEWDALGHPVEGRR